MQLTVKKKFASVLRANNISYQTEKDTLRIGNTSLNFFDKFEVITIRDNRMPNLWYTIHYATPGTVLQKFLGFKTLLTKWHISKQLPYNQSTN